VSQAVAHRLAASLRREGTESRSHTMSTPPWLRSR
jgi:hypothetical protein